MKRNLLLASGVLFALFLLLRDQSRFEEQSQGNENGNARLKQETPVPVTEPTNHLATDVLEDEEVSQAGQAGGAGEAPSFFPSSRVVASVTEPAGADGRQRVIETVETSMRERFVRVERVLSPAADGGSHVTSEVAMVANQLMLQKPSQMADYIFVEMLGRAGALNVKELGEGAFLATFEAQPADPRALDSHVAKVQELAGVEITVEPNYIRKIF
jgi:hypothetical protein